MLSCPSSPLTFLSGAIFVKVPRSWSELQEWQTRSALPTPSSSSYMTNYRMGVCHQMLRRVWKVGGFVCFPVDASRSVSPTLKTLLVSSAPSLLFLTSNLGQDWK